MLAEVFMLRLEANLRAANLAANDMRFVTIAPRIVPITEANDVPSDASLAPVQANPKIAAVE